MVIGRGERVGVPRPLVFMCSGLDVPLFCLFLFFSLGCTHDVVVRVHVLNVTSTLTYVALYLYALLPHFLLKIPLRRPAWHLRLLQRLFGTAHI